MKSDGGCYQCDCTFTFPNGMVCSCTGRFIIPKGQNVPSEPRCPQCSAGNHK